MSKPFRIRPYDPNRPRKPRTEAQERATMRNFTIARLRGLWFLAYVVREPRRSQIKAIIDDELIDLGCEPQTERVIRETAERDARWAAEDRARWLGQQAADTADDLDSPAIPF